jgi:hypothetical protein
MLPYQRKKQDQGDQTKSQLLVMNRLPNKTIDKINRPFTFQILPLLLASLILTGCFQHYYKTNSSSTADSALIEKLKVSNKYFIIHYGDNIKGAVQVKTTNDALEADLVHLPKEHSFYTNPKGNEENKMKIKRETPTLMEVHLYTTTTFTTDQTHITIPLSSINRLDIYEFDPEATRQNRFMSILGLTVGTLVIASTIAVIANPPVDF